MAEGKDKRLRPAEVELILRRASELNARRWDRGSYEAPSVSPEVLVQVAAAAGIPEQDVRRAMWDMVSEKTAEPHSFAWRFFGPARLRVVREVQRPADRTREHLEGLLRLEQGLKLRRKTQAGSLWDPGDELGMVRRTLDFSGRRTLLKARDVELRVEAVDDGLRVARWILRPGAGWELQDAPPMLPAARFAEALAAAVRGGVA